MDRRGPQAHKLLASDGNAYDHYGAAVAISGDVIVVGSNAFDFSASDDGQAYVYRFDGLDWTQEGLLRQHDNPSSANLGSSVAVDGDIVVVGARGARADQTGAAYVMLHDGQEWIYAGLLEASDAATSAYLGNAVAVANGQVLVGAPQDSESGNFAGALYGFGAMSDCNGNDELDVCDIANGTSQDCNHNSTPDDCDIAAGTSVDEDENGIPDECESILGDANCDGATDIFDIDAFVTAITNAAAYAATYPECDISNADCNRDGTPDVFDIDAFVDLVIGG